MQLTETLNITYDVTSRLKSLNIPHAVGGSVASSIYGIPRATQDIDILIRLYPLKVNDMVKAFKADYYIDESSVMTACKHAASFNLIHLESMFKIDFFVAGDDELLDEEFSRVNQISLGPGDSKTITVADTADMVIQKLLWYQKGGETSERQWTDIIGLITVANDDIDWDYVYKWVKKKSIVQLLEKAKLEAKIEI